MPAMVRTTAIQRSGSGRLPGIGRLSKATKTTFAARAGVAMETSPLCSERNVPICPTKKRRPASSAYGAADGFHPDVPKKSRGRKNRPRTMLLKNNTAHVVKPRPKAIFRQSAAAA